MQCPYCQGQGSITISKGADTDSIDCMACRGTGTLPNDYFRELTYIVNAARTSDAGKGCDYKSEIRTGIVGLSDFFLNVKGTF